MTASCTLAQARSPRACGAPLCQGGKNETPASEAQ